MGRNLKNVIVVSIGFSCAFTATGSLQSLQSSLNAEEGMGVISVSVAYSMMILSSLFVAPTLISYLGCKWTVVVCTGCSVIYTFGNFFPGWPSLITTSAIIGLGASPLWTAMSTYITVTGNLQAEIDKRKSPDVINQYFGILFLAYQSSNVWGNLLSSLLLEHVNVSLEDPLYCGASSCLNSSGLDALTERPGEQPLTMLLGCYLGIGLLGMLIMGVFLDNVKEKDDSDSEKESFCSVFFATFKQLKDYRQPLLIPLTIFIGLEISFLTGDYTSVYATCALGIHYVGFVMICFGASSSITALAVGKLSQYTGRKVLFAFAAVTNLSCIMGLLVWRPHPDQMPVFFIFPSLWGMADAIWQTQTNALYGVLFNDQKGAAFANYRLWESLGCAFSFALSNFICVEIKLYILIVVLVFGVMLYAVLEYKQSQCEIVEFNTSSSGTLPSKETNL
ncbi:protein unc-93 homolog A-like [Alosa pseudoharengus]|uniref:protein unc-93 homolog A-like n=1 Tax=Alosa pseudoharengus TaxID=34774 RepID=UPI003F8B5A49